MKRVVWKVSDRSGLYIEQWNENAIVYHTVSGATHLLNELAATALKIIQQQAVNSVMLADEISVHYELGDPALVQQQLDQLIKEFDNLGLIEACRE